MRADSSGGYVWHNLEHGLDLLLPSLPVLSEEEQPRIELGKVVVERF